MNCNLYNINCMIIAVFRRKFNQNLEKKFDVLEAKMADIQNEIEDLKTLISEQKLPQPIAKNFQKEKLTPPPMKKILLDERIVTLNKLQEISGHTFPLKTRKDFENFDEAITDELYNDLVSCVNKLILFII